MSVAENWPFLVQQRLRGCPEVAAAQAVREALRQVCRETDCWEYPIRFDLTAVPCAGRSIEIPDSGLPCVIHRVLRATIHCGSHQHFLHPFDFDVRGSRLFFLRPIIGDFNGLTLTVSLLPDSAGNVLSELPDPLARELESLVCNVAVSQLAFSKRKPWTDPDLANMARHDYLRELGTWAYTHHDLNHTYVIGPIDE